MKNDAKILTLNNTKENLTPEKLKTFSGCESLNEQEAIDTVFAIQTLANVLYEFINELSKPKELKTAA